MKVNEVVAVVTGGASGLGEATVRNIVSNGGKAVILDLQEESVLRINIKHRNASSAKSWNNASRIWIGNFKIE